MLPQAEQARKAIWDAINPHTGRRRIDEAFPLELRRRTRTNEMMIEFKNGSIWQVVGSDNYNALVGSPPIGLVMSEWALADPAAWAYMRPILRENGGWALFIYTPRGRNHGHTLYKSAQRAEGWFHDLLPADHSGVFSAEELALELKELTDEYGEEMGRALFEQEYMVSFDAANLGAVYARYIRRIEARGGICPLAYDVDYPVNTAWDFGFKDATSIWFWQLLPGPRIHVIDHYKNTGQDAKHYCERIHGRAIEFDAAGKIKLGAPIEKHSHRIAYRYGSHYVPHDGATKTLAAGGRSIGDQCFAMNVPMTVIPATSMNDSISAARKTLEICSFDMERCAKGIESLESYHYPWDDKLRTLGDTPVHDWSSHDADALEILGQVWQPMHQDKPREKPRFLHEATADEVFWPKGGDGGSKWNKSRV
jgi:phage terminase large subunit